MVNKKHLFQPGESGNPAGRPKGTHCISDAYRELLKGQNIHVEWTVNGKKKHLHLESDKNLAYGLASATMMEALKGNIRAMQEIADRVQGKAKQSIDIGGSADSGPINITFEEIVGIDRRSPTDNQSAG